MKRPLQIGWILLIGSAVTAWILRGAAFSVFTFQILVGSTVGRLGSTILATQSFQRWCGAGAAVGFLIVLLSWKSGGSNTPPWLRRLLPASSLSVDARHMALASALFAGWGWVSILLAHGVAVAYPALAFPSFLVVHGPLAIAQTPVEALLFLLRGASPPLPQKSAFTALWAIGGLVSYLLLSWYRPLASRSPV